MASISTSIELQDNFSSVMYAIINSINSGVSAMDDLQRAMSASIDTSAIEEVQKSIEKATEAVHELDGAIHDIEAPPVSSQNPELNTLPATPIEQPESVQLPVKRQSDNLEVFTGTGIERFQQEVQNTNSMLNTLNTTQSSIVEKAAEMDILPQNAIADMDTMQSRLSTIQVCLISIENNPLKIGSDKENAGLEQLRGQLNQAVQEQQNLNRAMDNMDVGAANQAYLQLSQTVDTTESYIRDNVDEQGRFNRELEQGTTEANKLTNTIKKAVASYVNMQTVGDIINLSDTMTQTTTRLNLIVDDGGSVEELQKKIYASAQASRSSYLGTAEAVSKLGLMAGDAFNSSDEIVNFMEQVNKQFTIAGTEASGIDAAMLQLTQAMGAGVLSSEQYNSILGQAPNIIQAIADYMDVPEDKLKDMAAEGQITADIVKAAMFASADETNAKFESMPKTFSQIWTSFQNTALMAFQPILQKLNQIANSEAFNAFISGAMGALSSVAEIVLQIFDALVGFAGLIVDNWSWISPIIYGVATALAIYYGFQLAVNTITAISTMLKRLAAIQAVAHGGAITSEMIATTGLTKAQLEANAALLSSPITWIIILIFALVVLLFKVIDAINEITGSSISATGIICGALAVALAFIGNLFVALWNLIVDVFVLIHNLMATVANFIANVFTDPIGAVCRLFADLADTVLGILQALASAIDTIFGSDLAGSVQGWRDSLGGWVDDTFGRGDEVMEKMNADDMKLGRFEYKDAWDKGYNFGENLTVDSFNKDDLLNRDDNYADLYDSAPDYTSNGAGSVPGNISNIADDTGDIKDTVDMNNDELKYLREIAERQAINQFTTAEVKLDFTANANINDNMDIDGFIEIFEEKMKEALITSAEGVHT